MSNATAEPDQSSGIDWPADFARTPTGERERNRKYDVTLAQALDDLEAELDRLGVDDWRLSTAAQQRQRDQRPYSRANPDDPGVVVRWSMDGNQYAVACDRYTKLRDNVRTVGLYIHEKRKMEQRPVETGESEFANARLPPADDEDVIEATEPPHEILGVAPDAPDEVVRAVARRLSADLHPDTGDGDVEKYKRVQEAKEAMLDAD
ncbi:hypothetical protein SAMN06269185_3299 [Natronoarchaeum philippinense]|uniref:J domain-containing protein n=1 Tax=Natronoarchaeum philippinense TaxID=558529 RepID=A0A285P923_NATPI|nr:DnaJ domain-containing protein [Natronoarchaeum philippinense]SNZ18222.1 hypothetical protein SAMN06269185_3299 [Natronoarchaeum philippinense]